MFTFSLLEVSLEEEARDQFKDVVMRVHQMRFPLVLDIGATHLRITSVICSCFLSVAFVVERFVFRSKLNPSPPVYLASQRISYP